MVARFKRWIERRRALRRLWQEDARDLINRDERNHLSHVVVDHFGALVPRVLHDAMH